MRLEEAAAGLGLTTQEQEEVRAQSFGYALAGYIVGRMLGITLDTNAYQFGALIREATPQRCRR